MQTLEVPYGRGKQICYIPDSVQCVYAKLRQVEPEQQADDEVAKALDRMIGDINWNKLKAAKSIAVAVSDITRPVPSRIILEQLLPWLKKHGVSEDRVMVFVGGGLHRPANAEDMNYIFGERLLSRISKFVAHNADDAGMLSFLGNSSMGTPVYVNKDFAGAGFKIVTGMVDAHQFMGFTAGVKGAVIGLAGRPTITRNHARLLEPGAELGRIEGNPARLDLEDIGRIIGVDMIVNVVLNDKKQVINAVAGDPVLAQRKAVEVAKSIFGVQVAPADIVIASPGGFPKDINLYQAQKAMTPAMQTVKKGGTIILVAECMEGTGEESFEKEMGNYKNADQVLDSFRRKEFEIGPHKAYLWARTVAKARVIIVSQNISSGLAKTLMVESASTLQDAVDIALTGHDTATLMVMPNASSVIPIFDM